MQLRLKDSRSGVQRPQQTGPTVAQLPQPVRAATVSYLNHNVTASTSRTFQYGGDESHHVRSVGEQVGDRPSSLPCPSSTNIRARITHPRLSPRQARIVPNE